VTGAFDSVKGVFTGVVDTVKSAFNAVWDAMSAPFNAIKGIITNFTDSIGAAFKWVWDKITSVTNLIKSVASTVGKFFGFGGEEKKAAAPTAAADKSTAEFARATSVLLDAANVLKAASQQLLTNKPSNLADSKEEIANRLKSVMAGNIVKPTETPAKVEGSEALKAASENLLNSSPAELINPAKMDNMTSALEKVANVTPITDTAAKFSTVSSPATDALADMAKTAKKPETKETTVEKLAGDMGNALTGTPADTEINLGDEIIKLNSMTAEMVRLLRESTDYAKRNVDATKSLSKNLFPS
jgi:hypothetical protein